jgi:outer membrane receptor protein involved in Fe transport
VDLTLRRDGSSRFGKDNRWGTFWSVGAMWNLMNETFMEDSELITNLKVKTSYGSMGNFNIPYYASQALFRTSGSYNGNNAGYLSTPGNSDLTWEKVNMFDVGFDIGFKDKINLEAGYYNKRTNDMLFEVPYSYTTGFSSGYANVGRMENQGFEAKLTADIIKNNDLKWSVGGTFAYNKNKVLELYGDEEEIPNLGNSTILKVGKPYGARYINRFAGVNPANGKSLWYDKEGNVTETFRSDEAVVLDKTWIPTMTGGFNTTVHYKGIELQADFSFMLDSWIINNTRFFTDSHGAFNTYNQSTKMLDYWKQPGDRSPNPNPLYGVAQFDDRLLEDASYLRLRSLILSYTFADKLVEKTKIFKKAKVFAQGYNLYTWTEYMGWDPEQYGPVEMGGYPQIRSYLFGIEIGF